MRYGAISDAAAASLLVASDTLPDPDAAYCTCPLADPELSTSSTRTLGGSAAAHKARQGIRPAARLRGFAVAPKSFPTRDIRAI